MKMSASLTIGAALAAIAVCFLGCAASHSRSLLSLEQTDHLPVLWCIHMVTSEIPRKYLYFDKEKSKLTVILFLPGSLNNSNTWGCGCGEGFINCKIRGFYL